MTNGPLVAIVNRWLP